MNKQVTLVEVIDPLDTRQRNVSQHIWSDGMLLSQLYPVPIGASNVAVCVNGLVIPQDKMNEVRLLEGDYVVIAPIPQGDGAKAILRVVALIAFSIMTAGAGAALAGAMGFTGMGLTIAGGILQAGIMMAGSMLINALLPPPKPKGNGDSNDSPSYGIDGPKNTSMEGVPVPVPYGTYRMAGNVIGSYVVNDGNFIYQTVSGGGRFDKTEQVQHLYMLINLGEGPISAISQIQLNGQPIEQFTYREKGGDTDLPAYEFYTYLGTPTQTAPQWFNKTVTPRSVSQEFTTGWTVFNLTGPADKLRVDLVSQIGIFRVNDEGDYRETQFDIELQYREIGATTWLPLQGTFGNSSVVEEIVPRGVNETNPWSGQTYTRQYRLNGSERRVGNTLVSIIDGVETVVADINAQSSVNSTGVYNIRAQHSGAWRRSITSADLTEAVYQVRFRRLTAESTASDTYNELFVGDINEIRDETVGYRNTALLALKLRVTDKLSGVPTVTALVDGRVINTWNAGTGSWVAAHSKNPAWIALDALTHARYGGGAPLSRFDLAMWKEWGAFCASEGLEFNGVFDTNQTAWDAIQNVLRCGHAQLVPFGTKFTVAIERVQSPVMMFTVANMVEGSFKINWLPVAERANEIELTYQDAADDYKQRTVKAADLSAVAAGQTQRTAQVSMMGVTSAQQAWEEATLMLNMNRYVLQTVQFAAPAEAIACTVGDVVLVQHDMPQWGFAGRTEVGSTVSVIALDRPVTMEYGKTYEVLLHYGTRLRASGTVHSIVGNTVFLNGYGGSSLVRRLAVGSIELAVEAIVDGGGGLFGVTVSSTAGITVGAAYSIYNTDELVSRAVVNPTTVGSPTAEVTSITLQTTVSPAPTQFTNWTFGETTKVAKPFRIRAISGEDPVVREITAIEYNASIYDPAGAVPTDNYSSLDQTVPQAVIFGVREELRLIGSAYKPVVTITFGPVNQQASYSRSEVLVAVGSSPFRSLGFGSSEMSLEANKGDLIYFRVIARDIQDRPADAARAPETVYRVEGETTSPGTVTGLASAFEDAGIRITWNTPDAQDWLTTIVRQGTTFATGTNVFTGIAPSCLLPFRPTGTTRYVVRHRFGSGLNVGADGVIDVVVSAPATPTPTTSQVQSGSVALRWGNLRTSQPLKLIEVRVGATYAGSTLYDNFSGSAEGTVLSFQGDGSRTIWVRAQDAYGNWGTQASTTVSVTGIGNGDMTVPATPTGLAVSSRFGTNFLTWTAPVYTAGGGHAETLIYGVTYTGGALPTFASAVLIGNVTAPGTSFADACRPGDVRHYWIVHVSKTGTPSAAGGGTNGVSITTARLANADMDDFVVTESKFAANTEPIRVVGALPNPSGYTGPKLVFLTTDGKVYRYTAGAWTAAVPAVDVSGQLASAQIADSAITAAKIAAAQLDASKFAASIEPVSLVTSVPGTKSTNAIFNTTDGKIYRWNGSAYTAAVPTVDLTGDLGGSNLLLNSSFEADSDANGTADSWTNATSGTTGTVTRSIVASTSLPFGTLAQRIECAGLTAGSWHQQYQEVSWTVGKTGVVSAYVRGTAGANFAIIVQFRDAGSTVLATSTMSQTALTTGFTRLSFATSAAPANTVTARVHLRLTGVAGGVTFLEVDNAQVEEGSVATAYSPRANEILPGTITGVSIADDAITAPKIVAGAITTGKIAAGAVTANEIAADTITANQIAANAITATEIAADAVTAGKIQAGAVSADKIAAGSISASKLFIGDVGNFFPDYDIEDSAYYASAGGHAYTFGNTSSSAIGRRFLQITSNAAVRQVESAWFPVPSGADIRIAGSMWLATATVGSGTATLYLELGSIDGSGVITPTRQVLVGTRTDSSALGNLIVNDATVTGEQRARFVMVRAAGGTANARFGGFRVLRRADGTLIVDGSITAGKIAALTITGNEIAAGTLTAAKLAAGTITANEMAANSITASQIATDAVTAGKIQAGAVTTDKLAANSVVASKLLVTNFTNVFPDFNCEDADYYSTPDGATFTRPQTSSTNLGARYINITSTAAGNVRSGWFSIERAADYFCSASAFVASATGGSGTCTVAIELGSMDASGVITPTRTVTIATRTDNTSQAPLTTNIVTAADERRARIVITRTSGTAAARAGGFLIQRRNNGALIVDGAITAAKIAAGTITANEIASGTITADRITAGTITTDRIQVGAATAFTEVSAFSASVGNPGGAATSVTLGATNLINVTPSVSTLNFRGKFDVTAYANSTSVDHIYITLNISHSGNIKWSVSVKVKPYSPTGGSSREVQFVFPIYIVDTGATPGVARQYTVSGSLTGYDSSGTAVSIGANGYLLSIGGGIQWYENKV